MTNKEAIMILESIQPSCGEKYSFSESEIYEAIDMAISAIEKQIPKKPKTIITNKEIKGNFRMVCPSCGWIMFERVTTKDRSEPIIYRVLNFCNTCGQRVDWSES